jgi:hypothetical protein
VKDSKADYETRVTKLTITPKGEPIFAEAATDVYLEDEAAGEFVVVEQHMEGYGKVAIDPNEWPTIKVAIEEMLAKSRGTS